jgi:hypothetical protein
VYAEIPTFYISYSHILSPNLLLLFVRLCQLGAAADSIGEIERPGALFNAIC